MKREYLVIAVIVLAIIGGLFLARPTIVVQPSDVTVQIPEQSLGAMPGSELQGDSFTVNGVTEYRYSCSFANIATSTACSIPLPNASTTVALLSARLSENTGAHALYVARATDRWATTTALISWTGTAGKIFAGSASTTLTNNTLEDNVLRGSSGSGAAYLNLGLEGTHTATGTMKVILRGI